MATLAAKNTSGSEPRFTAKVKVLAQESIKMRDGLTNDEQIILARIQKCLARANHPNTPEAEAQTALRMSSRLMTQYNITHADVLNNNDSGADHSRQAGQSTVSIRSNKAGGCVVKESRVTKVASAMTDFYDCKWYSLDCYESYEWTFYGIAPNTVAAAMSFEMVYNLIWNWSLGRGRAKFGYQHGIASGLQQLASQERKDEAARAKQQEAKDIRSRVQAEEAERRRELDRLIGSDIKTEVNEDALESKTNESHYSKFIDGSKITEEKDNVIDGDSDGDEYFECEPQATFKEEEEQVIDLTADFEEELKKHIIPRLNDSHHSSQSFRTTASSSEDIGTLRSTTGQIDQTAKAEFDEEQNLALVSWKSMSALVSFRQQAQKIAEDFLEAEGVKLGKARSANVTIRDWDAYREGKKDSNKIDVKRRRIES